MTTSAVLPETRSALTRPMNDWCFFLLENLDEFAKLAWYLVVDTALVECVMVRVLDRLQNVPFSASDRVITYNQARDTLIGEAIAVLNLTQQGYVETGVRLTGTVGLCDLPDLPRLAFLLKLVLLMPESQVARLLNVPPSSVSELIGCAVYQLSHRLPASSNAIIADV